MTAAASPSRGTACLTTLPRAKRAGAVLCLRGDSPAREAAVAHRQRVP
eukprot:CAMPEP_0174871646 /NCGR_PEP_ID=MMETSP1114-20130205/71886_1 /TAXON_ID=312471 /ORGANISM="Neobodo designis, Strain CCAP 1951/1" /LENGTH=47 /DNA_ID= /DNA_START= /DNA_END= /DNA_ORIENTATION=